MMTPGLMLAAVGAVLLLAVWLFYRALRRTTAPRRGAGKLVRYPSVTVIRPIKGLDAGAEQNIRAAFDHGYPGQVEILFVLDDEGDPAVPVVRRVMRELREAGRPFDSRVVFCGQPPPGRTGKLNAMIVGLSLARGRLVAFADSDIRPDRRALSVLVETLLGRRDAGAAFAPVVAPLPTRTVGDAGYSLLLNGLYGAAAAAATRRKGGELPFIMGQFMVFRREAIEAIGGLEAADRQLVDDMYLGACLNANGWRNVVAAHQVPIIQQGLALRDFIGVYRRWITFSRTGLPGVAFKVTAALHGVLFWLGVAAALASAATGHWLAAALNAAVPLALAETINRLHESLGGAALPWRHRWVAAGLLLAAPAIYLSIFLRRKVDWRGRSYDLDASSRLSGVPAASSAVEKAPTLAPPRAA